MSALGHFSSQPKGHPDYTFTSILHSLFPSCSLCLYLFSFSLSLSLSLSEDLTFFPLGSHCVLTGAFVTRHPLSVTEHSVLPLSFFLSFFELTPSPDSCNSLCLVVVPCFIYLYAVSLVSLSLALFAFLFPSLPLFLLFFHMPSPFLRLFG